MIYLGIDPGKHGAIALLWPGDCTPTLYDLTGDPTEDAATLQAILRLTNNPRRLQACMELVTAMPSDDDAAGGTRRGMGATSAFNFGQTVGVLRGILAALGISCTQVAPLKWRNKFFPRVKGVRTTRDERKRLSREKAAALYPAVAHLLTRVKDSDRADALLIAHYARHFAQPGSRP